MDKCSDEALKISWKLAAPQEHSVEMCIHPFKHIVIQSAVQSMYFPCSTATGPLWSDTSMLCMGPCVRSFPRASKRRWQHWLAGCLGNHTHQGLPDFVLWLHSHSTLVQFPQWIPVICASCCSRYSRSNACCMHFSTESRPRGKAPWDIGGPSYILWHYI